MPYNVWGDLGLMHGSRNVDFLSHFVANFAIIIYKNENN